MSDLTPSTPSQDTSTAITLPPGWQISPGRETSQINAQNAVIQGLSFPLTAPDGTITSVFIPYSVIHQTAAVQAIFDKRTSAVSAITVANS